jgi:hypothetical protein
LKVANTIANTDEAKTYKHEAIINIADKLASSGQIDRALQLVNQLDGYSKASALGAIASSLSSSGQFDRVLQLVKTIQIEPAKPIALARIADSLTDARQLEQALADGKDD